MSKNIALQSFVWAETKNIELSSWLVLHFCIFQLKHKCPSSWIWVFILDFLLNRKVFFSTQFYFWHLFWGMNVKRATLHQPIWKGAENCPPGVSEEARKSKYVLERCSLWVHGVHAPQNNHVLRLGTKCPALPRVCCPHQPLNHPLPSRPRYEARAFFCPPEHFFAPLPLPEFPLSPRGLKVVPRSPLWHCQPHGAASVMLETTGGTSIRAPASRHIALRVFQFY